MPRKAPSNNVHVAAAQLCQQESHDWQSGEGLTDATRLAAAIDGQTEATLALVCEQRTANLLTLLQHQEGGRGIVGLVSEIKERLDLA